MFLLKIAQIPIGVAKTTYTTWPKEKNILPSSKQKLICFRTIEQVGKAQYNISKLCLISISRVDKTRIWKVSYTISEIDYVIVRGNGHTEK